MFEVRESVRDPSSIRFLCTRVSMLDTWLTGGLTSGSITELVGAAGCGKTQFCLTLCTEVIALSSTTESGNRVLYFDTERAFDATRLLEIARQRYGSRHLDAESMEAFLNSVATGVQIEQLSGAEDLSDKFTDARP